MDGEITDWNASNRRGKVSGADGTHLVSAADCSGGLQTVLSNTAIPPDDAVEVTYDVAGTGEAINVDLARSVALAAAAAPMVVALAAKKAAPTPVGTGKAAEAPAETAKKSVAKKVVPKEPLKQPRKSAPKKRRP